LTTPNADAEDSGVWYPNDCSQLPNLLQFFICRHGMSSVLNFPHAFLDGMGMDGKLSCTPLPLPGQVWHFAKKLSKQHETWKQFNPHPRPVFLAHSYCRVSLSVCGWYMCECQEWRVTLELQLAMKVLYKWKCNSHEWTFCLGL